jgi:hypothetical protein
VAMAMMIALVLVIREGLSNGCVKAMITYIIRFTSCALN